MTKKRKTMEVTLIEDKEKTHQKDMILVIGVNCVSYKM
jgi:hypothetical protein